MKQSIVLLSTICLSSLGASMASAEGSATKAEAAEPPALATMVEPTAFEAEITQHLVRLQDGEWTSVPAKSLGSKDYYVFYYSAQWCPPCRKFTPKLAEFYDQAIGHHHNFELIFISSDRNEDAMKDYMSGYGMKFLARAFNERRSSKSISSLQGKGIPQLVVVDKNGVVVADSFENGDYVGPYKPLDWLIAKLHE